ncbi:hypothetical protein PBI_NEBKISS_44 [Mycobacterium phage Nebkiss]|nr:hypothetical protein PBI_NEBKISS_44 [Mycobacterium phage Nebkiss]
MNVITLVTPLTLHGPKTARDPRCEHCRYGTHICHGCGEWLYHGTQVCGQCQQNLDMNRP